MKVAIRKSVEIPKERRNDLIAFAGSAGCYRSGMAFRQVVQALAEFVGTGFLDQCYQWTAQLGPAIVPMHRRRQVERAERPEQKKAEAHKPASKTAAG